MATKYTRDDEIWEDRELRKTPWMRQGAMIRPMSRKQRIFTLFAGLLAIVLLSQIALNLNRSAPYAFQPAHRGEGIIVAQGPFVPGSDGKAGEGAITLEIEVRDGVRLRADWRIPEPYWSALAPGVRLAVLYQVNEMGTEIKILECGVVALKGDIR